MFADLGKHFPLFFFHNMMLDISMRTLSFKVPAIRGQIFHLSEECLSCLCSSK